MNINTLSILTQNAMPAAGVAIADIVKYVSGRVDQRRALLIDYLKMNDVLILTTKQKSFLFVPF
ncbi:hypothetical protein [Nostoc sp.]|uniref:hypothetical protein n=1 Tax=Nostoc sp. TaxID=1180 RepID=UPI002FFD4B73